MTASENLSPAGERGPLTSPISGTNPLSGPYAWHGADLQRDQGWRHAWTPEELAEIDSALQEAQAKGVTWEQVETDDFPLDRVLSRLAWAAEELEEGRGLVKFTGLPVARYDDAQRRLIWMALGRHLGQPVFQDNRGQMMRTIRNEGGDVGARHGRLSAEEVGKDFLSSKARTYSNGILRYHTDRTDVVGLLVVGQAAEGGISKVASAVAVHNEILVRRPDLLELLYAPYHRSRLGEEEGGDKVTYPLPIMGICQGKFTSHYSRTYVEAAQLLSTTPKMTAAQWEALDLLAAVADECALEMRLEPGDIQLLNNHVVYHARTPFKDDPASGQVRCLLRLWLTMANSRPLPADHAVLWGAVAAGSPRGGIGQEPIS